MGFPMHAGRPHWLAQRVLWRERELGRRSTREKRLLSADNGAVLSEVLGRPEGQVAAVEQKVLHGVHHPIESEQPKLAAYRRALPRRRGRLPAH